MDDQISRVAAELLALTRAKANARGNGDSAAWQADYGPRRKAPAGMEPKGLPFVGGGARSSRSGSGGKSSLVSRARILWATVMSTLCPGTRVFAGCLALASFILMA